MTTKQINAIEIAIVIAGGLVLFLLRFGLHVLDPRQINWLLARHDPAAYYLVWDFFRYEPWSFPLGQISNYLHPLGTSLPLADGLPLMAYPAKLFSPILPKVFQFFGLWHLICAVLQAFFGYRIVKRFIPYSAGRLLGSMLFLLAPVFLYREGHIALSSHWVLLAAIDLYLFDRNGTWKQIIVRWCALGAITALIHPYLVAMVLLFFAGSVFRFDREKTWSWQHRLVTAAAVGATIIFVWWLAGNLEGLNAERMRTTGFGYFSLNLNGFINPMGFGKLLSNLPLGRGQYEGFAYLGVGWILIAVGGLINLIFSRDARSIVRPNRVLTWVMLATFAYALSNIVMWNKTIVLEYLRIPGIDAACDVYRCSGRFVWPVIYAAMAGLIALLSRIRFRWPVLAVLGLALTLQVLDMNMLIMERDYFASMKFQTHFVDPNWNAAAEASSGITTVPPFKFSLSNRADYRDICWLATQHKIPTTAGYAARLSQTARALTDSIKTAIAGGTENPDHLYICDRPSFPKVLANLGDHFEGAIWDGYLVCYPNDWPVEPRPGYTETQSLSLTEFFSKHKNRTLLLAARDESSAGLTSEDRQALRSVGFKESDLAYRSAAAAIIHQGQTVWQQIELNKKIEFKLSAGEALESFQTSRLINVVSAGFDNGNFAQLRLDNIEEGFGGRGLNFLVLDNDQQLIEVAWFDTHAGLPGVVFRTGITSGGSR